MKVINVSAAVAVLGLAALGGCASTQSIPAGMKAGEFVAYNCDGGKRLMARAAADGSTVRVRYEGGYELDRKEVGIYEADGWKLVAQGGGAELIHNGKTMLKGCKPA